MLGSTCEALTGAMMLEWQLSELSYLVGLMKYMDLEVDGHIASWWMTVE